MTLNKLQGFPLALLTISVSLAIFMNVLDVSIANVAIPTISGDLGTSPNQGTWVITSFAVTSAIMLPLTGWLARRFGEVKTFVIATLFFTVTSWLCGLSNSFGMLIFFRVLQGIFAGPMIPLSQSLLLSHYPEEKKGLAMALWSMVAVVAPVFGPIMGGWITDNYSWPWIFYINVPVGLFSAYISWELLKNHETFTAKVPVDFIGLILLVIGIGCLQILLDQGNDLDWFNSNEIITLGVISFIAIAFFIVWEITENNPIVDITLFRSRNFTIGTIALSLGYLVFFGNVVIFPLWLQTQLNYTATWAGIATSPIGLLAIVFTPFVGKYLQKLDLRIWLSISFIVFAFVLFWNATFTTNISLIELIKPRLIMGIAIACFFTPLITIILSGLPPRCIASAAGMANFLRILGGSFGTSISVSFWVHRESFYHAHLAENITAFNPISVQAIAHTQQVLNLAALPAYEQIDLSVTNQSYMLSTIDFFWISAWVFLALLLLIWFTKPPFFNTTGTHHIASD